MKSFLLLALCALTFTGCANQPAISITAAQGAAALRAATSTAATLSLSRNPDYIPAATALAAGIDVALGASSTVTSDDVAGYVKATCARFGLPAADTAVYLNLAQSLFRAYVNDFKEPVIQATDPRWLLYLGAFKDGVNDALAAIAAAKA